MAYNQLGSRVTYYINSGTSTPQSWDLRGWGRAYYEQTSEDLATKQSKIKLEYGVREEGSFPVQYKVTGTIYQKINGVWSAISSDTYQSPMEIVPSGNIQKGTITDVIIPHDENGNAQVRVGVTITGQAGVVGAKSYVYIYDLPNIEEQASFNSITTTEDNYTLLEYDVPNTTYVNLLSKKVYWININNPNSLPIDYYKVINGTPTTTRHAALSSNSAVPLNFNDIQIYTEEINGQTRPSMIAEVHFQNGGKISSYINYNDNTFIPYEYPQFIPSSTTTKRNGQLSGKVTLNIYGTYYNGSIGTLNQGGNYKPTIKYKIWKTNTTEPSSYSYTISSANITVNNGTFSVTNLEIGTTDTSASNYFDYNYSYNVKLQVSDTFKSDEYTTIVTQGLAIWTEYSDRVDFRKITTNKIIANNIQSGTDTITNSSSGTSVTFDTAFDSVPNVVLTPKSTASGTISVKIIEITTTGFKAFNSTSSSVECCWIAMT